MRIYLLFLVKPFWVLWNNLVVVIATFWRTHSLSLPWEKSQLERRERVVKRKRLTHKVVCKDNNLLWLANERERKRERINVAKCIHADWESWLKAKERNRVRTIIVRFASRAIDRSIGLYSSRKDTLLFQFFSSEYLWTKLSPSFRIHPPCQPIKTHNASTSSVNQRGCGTRRPIELSPLKITFADRLVAFYKGKSVFF